MGIEHLKNSIRNIPDYPKPGIQFKDVTPILQDPELFGNVIDIFYDRYKSEKIDVIVGIESRGFIFAAPLAIKLGCSLAIARKPGKLPYETVSAEYSLEYGVDTLELHTDAIIKAVELNNIPELKQYFVDFPLTLCVLQTQES